MAQFYFHWRNVLICLCTPCILLTLIFIYITLMVCFNLAAISDMRGTNRADMTHFIASGTYRNEGLAPLPKTFWSPQPYGGTIWNKLQLAIDRYYNPILNQNKKRSYHTIYESLLGKSSSAAGDLNATMRNFAELPQQMQEFVNYMHKRDYPILIQPDMACGAGAEEESEPPLLLLAIKTTELDFGNRQAIRQSWGQAGWVAGRKGNSGGGKGRKGGGYVRRVFLLGKNNHEELGLDMSELLELERKHYGDILQWDFKDSFFNLTLKDVLFWRWFSQRCKLTRFVFKGDDDIFVNTPAMIDYLQHQLQKPGAYKAMRDFMVGDVISAALPNRLNISKYFIPDYFYKGLYPAYAGGGGVLYSGQLTKRLKLMSKRVHLFPIDDVYVGMCMIRLKAYPVHHPAFLTFDFPKKEEGKPCAYHTILMVHKRSPSQIIKLWAELNKTQNQCWNVTVRGKDDKKKDKTKTR